MDDGASYLTEVELALVGSPVILEYEIVRSKINVDDGSIRVRAVLINGDFLEASEYFLLQGDRRITADYRYQWMDSTQSQLRRRWDSTPHYPGLANFPHHVHLGDEETVVPGRLLSLLELLKLLETEIGV